MTPIERRNLLIAIIVLGLVAIGLLLWFLFRPSFSREPEVFVPAERTETIEPSVVVPAQPSVAPEPVQAQTVARNFVERFGTYSSDAPFANYEDVRELSTEVFYSTLVRTESVGDAYEGVTTYALSFKRTEGSEEEGRIVFDVGTQREWFTQDRSSSNVVYNNTSVTVVKVGDAWFVEAFVWE